MALTQKQIAPGGDKRRKLFACAIDVSETPGTPEYLVVGYKVSAATLETNIDKEKITDILGNDYSVINKMELSMQFQGAPLNEEHAGKLPAKLIHYIRTNQIEKFSQFKCILIYGFLGTGEAPYEADLYNACTVTPENLGGESWVGMDIAVDFGGSVVNGTVDKLNGAVKFTPAGTPVA